MRFVRFMTKRRHSHLDCAVIGLGFSYLWADDFLMAMAVTVVGAFVSVVLEIVAEARP